MNLIYLTSGAENKPRTLRVIRFAHKALGQTGTLDEAFRAYDELIADGEVLLGSADDDDARTVTDGIAAEGAECRVEVIENPADEGYVNDPPQAFIGQLLKGTQPQPSGNEPSFKASKCALILLHSVDGNPTYALSIARAIGRATEDAIWNEVEDAILESFPPVRIR